MDRAETTRLLVVATGVWPAMRLEEHTVETWTMVLDDVPYHDAAEALKVLARTSTFPPAVADVMREVRKTWDRRENEYGVLPTPNVDPDDHRGYRAEQGALRHAIRRGTFDREQYATGAVTLTGRKPYGVLEAAGRQGDSERVKAILAGTPA